MEIWKDVIGYEGIYEVSNLGNVRTHEGKTTNSDWHGKRVWKQRILKQKISYKDEIKRVSLYKNKKCTDYLVCRLVASSFIENNLYSKLTVNHKDGNRLNNNVENLEWMTLRDNIRHGFENGLYKQHKVILEDSNGTLIEFRSKSKCAEFLKLKSSSLFKDRERKSNNLIKSKDGDIFKIISIEINGGWKHSR